MIDRDRNKLIRFEEKFTKLLYMLAIGLTLPLVDLIFVITCTPWRLSVAIPFFGDGLSAPLG